jgi:hypothetical protein
MDALVTATENLDTFERKLANALWFKAGIVLPKDRYERICSRIPRHVDCSGRDAPLIMTKDAIQEAFLHERLTVEDARCFAIAEAVLPYIAVTDSNLE